MRLVGRRRRLPSGSVVAEAAAVLTVDELPAAVEELKARLVWVREYL